MNKSVTFQPKLRTNNRQNQIRIQNMHCPAEYLVLCCTDCAPSMISYYSEASLFSVVLCYFTSVSSFSLYINNSNILMK